MWGGKEFHILGAETRKAREPNERLCSGTGSRRLRKRTCSFISNDVTVTVTVHVPALYASMSSIVSAVRHFLQQTTRSTLSHNITGHCYSIDLLLEAWEVTSYFPILADPTAATYNLRPRCHSFSLTVKTDSRNYINRMLFKDIY